MTSTPPDPTPREASLTEQAQRLLFSFGEALDENDWDAYRACLADELLVDYSQSAQLPATRTTARDWTAFVRSCVEAQQTVHYFTNVSAWIEGGIVTARANHMSCHWLPDNPQRCIQYGTYGIACDPRPDDRLILTRIEHRVTRVEGVESHVDTTAAAWIKAAKRVFGSAIINDN